MKRVFLILLTGVYTVLGVASCTTIVTARKASTTKATPGIRYYLPQPFLLMRPTTAGMSHEIVYIPDRDAEYTIDINYLMTSGKPKIMRDVLGMLKSVSFDMDNTAVAKELLNKTGDAGKSAFKASGDQKKADQGVQALVFNKQAAVRQAELKVKQATEALATAKTDAEKASAQAGVSTAEAALDKARLDLDIVREGASQGFTADQLNLGNASGAETEAPKTADQYFRQPGGMLYRIVQTKNSVSLQPVLKQSQILTVFPNAKKKKEEPQQRFKLTLKESKNIKPGATLLFNGKSPQISMPKGALLKDADGKVVPNFKPEVKMPAGGSLTIQLPDTLAKSAKYSIDIVWSDSGAADSYPFETAK